MPALPLAEQRDGVVVTVRLTPRARTDAIDGLAEMPGPRGSQPVLAARVTAPPDSGAANAALIALLARSWRLPRSALSLESGAAQRVKRIKVAGDPASLMTALASRLATPDEGTK